MAVGVASAGTLPSHGHYVDGRGSINKANRSLTVKQSSTTGIINWKNFSVGAKNGVTFDNGSGATLNRVTGGNLSTIAGSLHATGSLYLVNSQGVIVSGTGRVITGGNFVASTGSITNDAFENGRLKFHQRRGQIVNDGSIVAGGNVRLSAGDLYEAGSASGSKVILKAANHLDISGAVTARKANGDGGTVIAAGRHIDVTGTAHISASGVTGGIVLIGGELHGGATAGDDLVDNHIKNARKTKIGKGAEIAANASAGAGGDIVIWSNGHTTFEGKVSAKGKSEGGFAEISSHKKLGFDGKIDLLGRHGPDGSLLLDPENVVISNNATANGSISGGTFTPTGDDSVLNAAALDTALATANVTVTSVASGAQTGDITVLAPVTWSSSHTLTLDSYHSIVVGADITITGAGGLTLTTNDGGTSGDYSFANGASASFTDAVSGNTQGSLTINGTDFTLVNSVSQLASAISNNQSGNYALAKSYDASADGTRTSEPTTTILLGTFEGLGNTISNLAIHNANSGENAGLLYKIGSTGVVRDLTLSNVNITGSGASEAGGLAGDNEGLIRNVSVSGSVSSGTGGEAGGLVGYNGGTIARSSSTASVSAADGSDVGGLVGFNAGSISQSHAEGAVSAGDGADVGGFVGDNTGAIATSYAFGSVTGGNTSTSAGGFAGENASTGTIDQAYSLGIVTGGSATGGFVGDDESSGGITNSYWDESTSGIGDGSQGAGNTASDSGITGLGTGDLQSMLPSGFDSKWSIVAGASFPYLAWQFSGTPQVVSGTVDDAVSVTTVGLTVQGAALGSVTTYADGEYYYLAAPGSIPASGVVATTGSGTSFEDGASGFQALGLDIFDSNALHLVTTDTTLSALSTNLSTAAGTTLGGAFTSVNQLVNRLGGGLQIDAEGNFALDQALAVPGFVAINAYNGSLTLEAALSAGGDLDLTTQEGSYFATLSTGTGSSTGSTGSTGSGTPTGSGSGGAPIFTAANGGSTSGLDITILTPLSFSSAQRVDMQADGSVIIDKDLTMNGLMDVVIFAGGTITFNNASAAFTGSGGQLFLGEFPTLVGNSRISFGSLSDDLNIGTDSFTLVPDVATLASDIASNPGGLYALADNYDASGDNGGAAYAHSPIPTTFSGLFEGLGNTISNLKIADTTASENVGLFSALSTGYIFDVKLANVSISGGDSSSIGGLVGTADVTSVIRNDSVTGNVSGGASDIGGLVGTNTGSSDIENSYSLASVSGGDNASVGGLVGHNTSSAIIEESYATGAVSGTAGANVGGFVGSNDNTADIKQSYATGSASAGDAGSAGGFAGSNDSTIEESYAMGPASAGSIGFAGGFVGTNSVDADISDSYSLGMATGGGDVSIGGFAGTNAGTISDSFWNTDTSGIGATQGAGNIASDTGLTGLTTASLMSALPGAFNNSDWSIVAGTSFPYLSWQFAGDTPEVISGSIPGINASESVTALSAGSQIGQMNSFADNSFYLLVAPGTVAETGVAVYDTGFPGSMAFSDSSTRGLTLVSGLTIATADTSLATLGANVGATLGTTFSNGGPAPTTMSGVMGEVNNELYINASGAFNVDQALTNEDITITAGGNLTISQALSASEAVVLNATGTISETGAGAITGGGGLQGTSQGAVTLGGANQIEFLDNFSTGGHSFSLTDDRSLEATGTLNTGSGALTLTTTAGGIAVENTLKGGTVDLVSASTISESGSGKIDATKLTGSSHSITTLNGANVITDLGTFTSGSTFALTDDHDLTVDGTVKASGHTVELTTKGSGHDIKLDAKIDAHELKLVSAATVTENNSGDIDVTELTGSSASSAEMNSGKNTIADLGSFTSGGAFELTDDHTLKVEGTVDTGSHTLDLRTVGKSHGLAIDAKVEGGTINLATTGEATESKSGEIEAKLLNVTAETGIKLTSKKNKIKKLGTHKTKKGPNKITL